MDIISQNSLQAADFYDKVSVFYEKMIDFEKNLELRINAYKSIFETMGTTADLGCGIGLDSIALAINGQDVTAFDVSSKMIDEANKNAARFNVKIKTHAASIELIPVSFNNSFQNIVCVGNTIAHLSTSQLKKALIKIHELLKPNGKAFLHILNYEMIAKQNKRINNIAVRNGMVIIRFYDFFDKYLNFNIMSFNLDKLKDFKFVTTKHFPHKKSFLNKELRSAGFRNVGFYGDFEENRFEPSVSKDMFVAARK